MSNPGQSNFRGVNYQAWAAMLLFLIRANDPSFESITLEDAEWEDFTLSYSSGKKIVCESKYRATELKPSLVKEILKNISERDGEISETDEILIICPSVSEELESNIRYFRWDPERIGKWFKEKGFTDEAIKLIPHVSFFKTPSAEYLYNEALAYFYNLNEVGHAWLPQSEVDAWIKKTLVDEVYTKSANGTVFTRAELLKLIDTYFREKIELNGVYDAAQSDVKERYQTLLKDLDDKSIKAIKRDLSVLSAQPQLMYIALDRVLADKSLKLSEWDVLWSHLIDRQYWFRIVHEFKDRLADKDNSVYVLGLFKNHVSAFINPAFDDFRAEYAIQLTEDIVQAHPDLAKETLVFAEEFIRQKRFNYQDLDEREAKQEKVEISKLLALLYDRFTESGNDESKAAVLRLISESFSLVEDDGSYYIHTPSPIFQVMRKHVESNFADNLQSFKELVVKQFNGSKYYKNEFSGWEATGAGLSQYGSDFSISDKHFIDAVIVPSLMTYYQANKNEAWNLVTHDWVTTDPDKINSEKPDFLNRASILVLLEEYSSGEHSKAAFDYLKALMTMKGVPSKFEHIFQAVRDHRTLADEKKWALAEAFIDYYTLPHTVFVEQVVSDLAVKGTPEAIKAIEDWVKNPDYRELQRRHSFFIAQSMFKLLATSPESESYKAGIGVLELYLDTDDFINKLDNFDSYDISRTLARILEGSYPEGLELLRRVYTSSNLTKNQQTLIWHSIEQVDKENGALVKQIYDDFVKPVLVDELEADNKKIEEKFTAPYARELIAQYAEHLAMNGHMDDALTLVNIFIADSNPTNANTEDDPEGTFNYHERVKSGEDVSTINTVRAWVSWILRQFSAINGRDYLEEVADKVDSLAEDENYYVRCMATFPMIDLARNRHTVLPSTDERFMSLDLAKKIEAMIIKMIENNNNPVILKHLVHVLQHVHTFTAEQALRMFEVYGLTELKPVAEDIVLLLPYYALYRKNDFKPENYKKLFGDELYSEINNFDDQPFVDLLNSCIDSGDDDLRTQLAWYFWTLPKKNSTDYDRIFDISLKHLDRITNRYTRDAINRVGYFISENLEKKPAECLALWEKLVKLEKDWLNLRDDADSQKWWPHHQNDEFLEAAISQIGADKYLEMLEVLLEYPNGYNPRLSPDIAYTHLKQINTEAAQKVLKKLMDKYPQLYMKEA